MSHPPTFTPLFTLQATLMPSLDSGADGPIGRRVLNAIVEGRFDGPRLRGTLHAGTGDWMLTRRDGVMNVDARVVLKVDDGAVIHMSYGGRIKIPADVLPEVRDPLLRHLVDPSRYYFRTTPVFETGAPAHAWLNDLVCIGMGRLLQGNGVAYEVYAVD
jgi:hypothetical protein